MNLCHARIEEGPNGLSVQFGKMSLGIDKESLAKYPQIAGKVGSEVVLGTRPESFSLAKGDVPVGQEIQGKVDLVEMLGAEALVYIQNDAKPASATPKAVEGVVSGQETMSLVTRISPKNLPVMGEIVKMRYENAALHFFDPKTGRALR